VRGPVGDEQVVVAVGGGDARGAHPVPLVLEVVVDAADADGDALGVGSPDAELDEAVAGGTRPQRALEREGIGHGGRLPVPCRD
jgi:hypothetical protein